jgi:hypothetical protein
LQTGQTGFLRGLKIEGWFTALGCRQNNQVEVGISQKLSSHVGRLNRLPTFDRFLDLVAHHRCRCG